MLKHRENQSKPFWRKDRPDGLLLKARSHACPASQEVAAAGIIMKKRGFGGPNTYGEQFLYV
jgi:hypothetical protein